MMEAQSTLEQHGWRGLADGAGVVGDPRDWARRLGIEASTELDRLMGLEAVAAGPIGVIDLFCGCGGLSVGFEAVGRLVHSFRLVGAADFDPDAAATYRRNLPIGPDVVDLASPRSSIPAGEWKGPLIVVGGPPCQGFSAHGKKHGRSSDERNALVLAFARHAVTLAPDLIAMENVPEVLSKKHWRNFARFRAILGEAGYQVRAQIHNLAGFGVPQERFRALVIASRSGHSMPRPYFQPGEFRTVRAAIGGLRRVAAGEKDRTDPMHVSSAHRESTIQTIRRIPKNGGSRPAGVGPECLDRVDGFRDVYGRMSWDSPSNTITAYCRNPASGRYIHPEQDRGLTVREAALLQGFPRSFHFEGPFGHRFQQIGNAVPPRFAAYLAAHLLGEMLAPPWRGEHYDGVDVTSPTSNSFSSGIAGRKKRPDV